MILFDVKLHEISSHKLNIMYFKTVEIYILTPFSPHYKHNDPLHRLFYHRLVLDIVQSDFKTVRFSNCKFYNYNPKLLTTK